MANRHVNAIVVGSGAGGGVVAKELAVAGLSVVLFERGKWIPYKEHGDDELMSQRTTVLGNGYGPDDRRYRRVVVDAGGFERVVLPSDGAYNNVAACVGSGTVCFGAMAWRFMPQDFKLRSTYGHLAGSTVEDWPITYEDLEPYYEKAEWEVGVSGDDTDNPFAPPRKKPRPMPAFQYNTGSRSPGRGRETPGLAPLPDTHAPQFHPLWRPAGLRASHQLRRVRLPAGCQRWHAEHGDTCGGTAAGGAASCGPNR